MKGISQSLPWHLESVRECAPPWLVWSKVWPQERSMGILARMLVHRKDTRGHARVAFGSLSPLVVEHMFKHLCISIGCVHPSVLKQCAKIKQKHAKGPGYGVQQRDKQPSNHTCSYCLMVDVCEMVHGSWSNAHRQGMPARPGGPKAMADPPAIN